MPSDLAATGDAGHGLPLDAAAARDIAFVGFDGDDDIRFIGFDDERVPAAAVRAAALPHGLPPPPPLAERLWRRVRSRVLGLLARLRFQLIGTHLHARRTRNALVVLGAVVLSVGCGLALRNWLPARQAASNLTARIAAPAAPAPRAVLVADKAIPRGHLLHPDDLRWQRWPADRIKEGFIEEGARTLQELAGYAALQPLAAGDPVPASAIVKPGKRGFLAAALAPGMRAVSVDIREETAAGGLIMPGDEVDILLALPVPDPTGEGHTTHRAVETVLTNVPVLAIDQQLDAPPQHAIVGSTATVAVTPKQAEIITLADSMASQAGNLRLTLHSLVRHDGATAVAAAPGSLVESDISKLLPAARRSSGPPERLTIVRRGEASAASGS